MLFRSPVLSPHMLTEKDYFYILPRAFELIYTATDLKPFAEDLWNESSEELRQAYRQNGFDPEAMAPFAWDEDRRAVLRAELDAYYARLYGLTRDELRYILDPQDVYGPDFPGETFRVLKDNETARYGEYRTRRLVLEAWDRLESALGPVDPDRLKSYVSPEPAVKAAPAGKSTAASAAGSAASRTVGKQASAGSNSAGTSHEPSKPASWGSPAKSRTTQATLFPEDEDSPQPALFTSAGRQAGSAASSNTKSSGQPSTTASCSKPAASKPATSAATAYPVSDNYKLFKCSVCGRLIPGFSRPAHETSHPGRKVEWKMV